MVVPYPNLFRLGYGCDPQTAVAPPTLSYATPQSWTYGAAISTLSPTTTGATSFAVTTGALPTGVSLNTTTGDITGTPTAWAASGSVTIRATGAGGTADSTINWTMAFDPSVFGTVGLYLTADGTLWQDSGRTTPAVADADPVGAWDDGSGNSRHPTQGTAGARATLKLAILNGRPVVRFDGVDDVLSFTSAGMSTVMNGSWTVMILASMLTADAGLWFGRSGNVNQRLFGPQWLADKVSAADEAVAVIGSGVVDIPFTPTVPLLAEWAYDGATLSARKNAGAALTAAYTYTGNQSSDIHDVGGMGGYPNVDIAVVLIWASVLSDVNRALVESYLNAVYAVY